MDQYKRHEHFRRRMKEIDEDLKEIERLRFYGGLSCSESLATIRQIITTLE